MEYHLLPLEMSKIDSSVKVIEHSQINKLKEEMKNDLDGCASIEDKLVCLDNNICSISKYLQSADEVLS